MRITGNKLIVAAIVVLWTALLAFGAALSRVLAGTAGEFIAKKTRGLIPDPEGFFLASLQETILIVSAILVVLLVLRSASAAMKARGYPDPGRYITLAALCFVCLNGLFIVASTTTVFWISSYLAYPNYKQAFFNTNKTLLGKSSAATRVVIAGSSQGHSQFDAGLLNESYYPQAQFANLSYAGSSAWDLRLTHAQYEDLRPRAVIVYISVMNFYERNPGSSRIIPLVRWSTWPDVYEYMKDGYIEGNDVIHAGLSLAFPVFKFRRSLDLSVFGELAEKGFRPLRRVVTHSAGGSKKVRYADRYELGERSAYQQAAFSHFLDANIGDGIRPIIVVGQVNPELSATIEAAVLADYGKFVANLKKDYEDSVTFIERDDLYHEAEDYDDNMHVNRRVRTAFTAVIAQEIAPVVRAGFD